MDKEDIAYIYTKEYYLDIKKNEILPFAVTWMDLENIMLSEISQTEKYKHCMISLMCNLKNNTNELLETDSQI